MHRLYWKIFISFWLSLIVFALATIFTASQYLDHLREQRATLSPRVRLLQHVEAGQRIAERDGIEGLRSWLRRLDRREAVPLLLLDRDGNDLLGRPVPERIVKRQRRWQSSPRADRWPGARTLIRLADASAYRLVPDFQSLTLGRVLHRPRVIALPLLLAALVSALVSILLARYLTAPLERLGHATEAYAAGDLGQRVAPSLGTRRDEIADLARAFDRMAQRLQELMATQKQLLRDVSHELRSPLARQRVGAQAEAEFERIERETDRLNDLMGQLLSLARLESAATLNEREPIDLAELLAGVAADADFEARAKGCRVEITGSVAAVVHGNAELLHSAIENVVRNVVRHTRDGSAVEILLAREAGPPGRIAITIRDHGPGVPAAALPRLFEPFVRVGEARERASGGYGLGLAIADRAVRLHGGEIGAHNAVGGGLALTISLPQAT